MSGPASPAPRPWTLLVATLALISGVFFNSLNVGFMWDDHLLIVENTDLHALHPPWVYLRRSYWQHPFFSGDVNPFFRPLVVFSFAVDWAVGGGSAVAFHATNVALHLVVCAALFFLVQRQSGSAKTAAVAASVFGVTPRLTESVSWVAGRTDVMATAFVLLALLAVKSPRWRWAVGPLLGFGLLAKEVALVGCAMLGGDAVLGALRRRAVSRDARGVVLHVVGAVVCWAALRWPTNHAPLVLQGASTFLAGVGQHVVMLLSPWDPNVQINFIFAPPAWAAPVGALTFAALGGAAVSLFRQKADFALLCLLGAALGVVAVTAPKLSLYTLASDRFLYLPCALLLGMLASRPWPTWALWVGLLCVVGFAPLVVAHNQLWASPLTFWREAKADADPRNPGPVSGLADALKALSRFEEALPLYEQAVALTSNQPRSTARLSRAVVLSKLGRDLEALQALDAVLHAAPDSKRARYDLVLFRARAADLDGARQALDENRSTFGDDEVLRSFGALLQREAVVARDGRGLERARALATLGATRRAEAGYLELLTSPDDAAEAAQWLVVFGSRPSAERALAVLQGSAAAQAQFDERFSD